MTDLREMAEAIAAEEARLNPTPGMAAAVKAETRYFDATVLYANIYAPSPFGKRFSLIVPVQDVPRDLHDALSSIKERNGKTFTIISSAYPAAVVPTPTSKCSLDTTLSCTRAANIRPDALLVGLQVKMAVTPYRREASRRFGRPSPGSGERSLALIAIMVDAMVKRYDEICAEHFCDASYPSAVEIGGA